MFMVSTGPPFASVTPTEPTAVTLTPPVGDVAGRMLSMPCSMEPAGMGHGGMATLTGSFTTGTVVVQFSPQAGHENFQEMNLLTLRST